MPKIRMQTEIKKSMPTVDVKNGEKLQRHMLCLGWIGVAAGFFGWMVSTIALYYREELVDYLIDTFKLFGCRDGGLELMEYLTMFATLTYCVALFNLMASSLLLIGVNARCKLLVLPWISYNVALLVVNMLLGSCGMYFAVINKSVDGFFFVFVAWGIVSAFHIKMLSSGISYFKENHCICRQVKKTQRCTMV